jgi:DNA mismatch endonuclease (patch repair protein)
MTDTFTKIKRSSIMASILSSGTKPELFLGDLLRELIPKMRIRKNLVNLPGKPDYYIPKLKIAFFADGCFFHGCRKHLRMPKDNRKYWKAKIERNQSRDIENNRKLRQLGIKPIRIWEHDLRKNNQNVRNRIKRIIRNFAK